MNSALQKTSKVKKENYIQIQGWMLTDLKLKGNELIIYACIYGFTQAENQIFNGGLQYLADWTNSTKQGVIKCLKSLIEKGLLIKTENVISGVKFCEYRTTELNTALNKVAYQTQQSLTEGIQQSLNNNIDLDNTDNKLKDIYSQVIGFLNDKTGGKYRATTPKTQQLIKARLNEGFGLDDFYTVIDKKAKEWKGTEWEQYLRPETLFSPKFEGYLNAPLRMAQKPGKVGANGVRIAENGLDDLDGVFK